MLPSWRREGSRWSALPLPPRKTDSRINSIACPNNEATKQQNRIKATLCRRVSYQYLCSHNIHSLCSSTKVYDNMVNFVLASSLLLLAITDGSTVSAATAKRTVCLHICVVSLSVSFRIILCSFLIHTVDLLPFAHIIRSIERPIIRQDMVLQAKQYVMPRLLCLSIVMKR